MTCYLGTDEAGYGPNLGPLTVTATLWEFPQNTPPEACRDLLQAAITQKATRQPEQIQVADSKQVYSSGRSIAPLEQSVLTLLARLGHQPTTATELGNCVSQAFAEEFRQTPCRSTAEPTLPLAVPPSKLAASVPHLEQTLADQGVRLLAIRSQIVFPTRFNDQVDATGSKGKLLSAATLQLVAELIREFDPQDTLVVCDKHGGRNRYDDLISAAFDDQLVFRLEEGRNLSRYRLDNIEFRFQTKAEEHLPVAAASLVSKYLREVLMQDFNQFWQQRVPDLKPTKGYPVDAARFMDDIADALADSEIDRRDVWRQR